MAVAKDDADAQMVYGYVLLVGIERIPPAPEAAIPHLKLAAERGRARAWLPLWLAHRAAGRGVEQIELLRKGAEAGDPQAQMTLCKVYEKGDYVRRDLKQAERWGLLAVRVGDPEYQRALGEFYMNMRTPAAYGEAAKWLKLANEGGDMRARFLLSIAYANGVSADDGDRDTALKLLREAAEAGVPDAEEMLADHYLYGLLVERNLKEARRWYEKAKAHGVGDAEKMLRWMDFSEKSARTK